MKYSILLVIFIGIIQSGLFAQEKNVFDWEEIDTHNTIENSNKLQYGILNVIKTPTLSKVLFIEGDSIIELRKKDDYKLGEDGILTIDVNKIIDELFDYLKNPKSTDILIVKLVGEDDDIKEFEYPFKSIIGSNDTFDLTRIPIFYFIYIKNTRIRKKGYSNRVVIIDADPNPLQNPSGFLYKFKNDSFKRKKSLFVNSNIPIYLKNYNLRNINEISLKIDGLDYTYSKDLIDLLGMMRKVDSSKVTASRNSTTEGCNLDTSLREKDEIKIYLTEVYQHLDTIRYVNIDDYMEYLKYLDTLNKVCNVIKLSDSEYAVLKNIHKWRPEYIQLKPNRNNVPNKDEIILSLVIKEEGRDEIPYPIGRYKTIGGSVTSLSTSLFITNLVNNKIYIDSIGIQVNDTLSTNELRAFMENDIYSIGIGLNVETAFHTGFWLRPSFNVGMFVPFDEDVTPYLALGVGGAIVLPRIKLSMSIGGAGGFVNKINSKYKDKDLSKYPNYAEDLYDKEPKLGWQVSFGVSFSIN